LGSQVKIRNGFRHLENLSFGGRFVNSENRQDRDIRLQLG
jgi:hypothetical protein